MHHNETNDLEQRDYKDNAIPLIIDVTKRRYKHGLF